MRATALAVACVFVMAAAARGQDATGWYPLDVPGGRATLRALGVADEHDRAAVMIELIRRLQFVTKPPLELEAALKRPAATGPERLTLPMPLPADRWPQITGRPSDPANLFFDILADRSARLLFHGLAGMDQDTRQWMTAQPGLLRALARDTDAVKSFALFAPAVRISKNIVIVPGGPPASERWSAVIAASPSDARAFVTRLFMDRAGRTAGLYFLLAYAEEPRRQFLLGDSREALERLAGAFASCYPRQSNDYPFVLRSSDPAILLLNLRLTEAGVPRGPRSRAFWNAVMVSDALTSVSAPADGRDAAAADLVGLLCSAAAINRADVSATLLAGSRVFGGVEHGDAETLVALRVRRRFPALFAAIERAGVREPGSYASLGRYAEQLDRVADPRDAATAAQQFQGVVSVVAKAAAAHTLDSSATRRLLAGLTTVTLRGDRYNRAIAQWIGSELLPVFRQATVTPPSATVEQVVSRAIAGPSPTPPQRVMWEGLPYVLDYGTTTYARLLAVRARQGGPTLDEALSLSVAAKDAQSVRDADSALGQALAAWAYAPHLGEPDGGSLTGGDPSLRHDLGIRQVNRTRIELRWQLALTTGDRGSIAGSYLGLDAALAGWSLRRLSTDTIPAPPTIGDNDRSSMVSTLALLDPARLADAEMHRIAAAMQHGARSVDEARADGARLIALADEALVGPWRRQVLPWMVVNEPDRIVEMFPPVARARLGGLRSDEAAAWGPSMLPLGSLDVQAPPSYIPDLVVGRPIDGIVGAYSADLMFRVAELLDALKLPAAMAPAVLAYAMRDAIDRVRPAHPADTEAFSREAQRLTRVAMEDYLGAIAAAGPLRPIEQ